MQETILETKEIKKSFNGIEVLHSIDFTVKKGNVVALVGENGAGKSTLMKILMGEYQPDEGQIIINGKEMRFSNPHQALENGISMIFQEMSPFPNLTVAENVFVGREPRKAKILINTRKIKSESKELLNRLNINLDINKKVQDLTVSEMQLLEIAKAVSHHSKIVIMDEPTSALTDTEARTLFDIIGRLKKQEVSIIYITHKLEEIKKIADQICVLRDGCIINTHPIEKYNQNEIVSEMVGRKIDNIYPHIEKKIGEAIFKVENYSYKDYFRNISFELRSGEILGFAGMVGAGRTEIVSSLFGILPHDNGKIVYKGKPIEIKTPADAVKYHLALIPEDRARDGLNLLSTIRSNLATVVQKKVSNGFVVSSDKEAKCAKQIINELSIKCNSDKQSVSSLSGGNQQKIVVGKWLLTEPDVIFLDEPTRGIDVGAKYQIYQLIENLAKEGKAIIMISSEMPELLGICDRILVLKKGRLVGEFNKEEATQEKIMTTIVNA